MLDMLSTWSTPDVWFSVIFDCYRPPTRRSLRVEVYQCCRWYQPVSGPQAGRYTLLLEFEMEPLVNMVRQAISCEIARIKLLTWWILSWKLQWTNCKYFGLNKLLKMWCFPSLCIALFESILCCYMYFKILMQTTCLSKTILQYTMVIADSFKTSIWICSSEMPVHEYTAVHVF